MFMDKKMQYCQDISSFQIDLKIKRKPSQIPSKLFCGHQQIDSKVYMKIQNSHMDSLFSTFLPALLLLFRELLL